MSNTIIELRHSFVTGNVPSSLANGEIAINTFDGKLFYRGGVSNTIQTIERFEGPGGLDTEIQFNDSGVLGSDSELSFNKTTDVLSAKNIVVSGNSYFGNANLHEGITQLSVTNAGSGAYLFDQYAGSNPALYVGAGETLSFNLNVVGHPFLIRESSGGANTSAGLTHISTTGVVSTEADAQGKVSGVLFWKVPFSLVGSTYVYQCQIHGGMVGNIVIQQPASFVAANTTLAFNQANAAFDNSNTKFNSSGGTISGNVFVTGGLFPSVDNTGVVGNSAFTWDNGQFTDLTIDNILNVRTAIDLADGDILRFGTSDDWEMFHDGTANRIDLNNGDLTIRDDGTAGDPTRFTFGRTTGAFTANGNVSATNFLVGSLNVNEHAQSAFNQANSANILAQASFDFANTISGGAAIDNVAREQANTAIINAESAFSKANSANVIAQTAFDTANNAATIGDILAISIALG